MVEDEDAGSDTGENVLGTGTTYHVWADFERKTGSSDSTIKVYYSTNATKPGTAEAEIAGGSFSADCGRVNFGTRMDVFDYKFDKVRVDDEIIGSNPS